MSDLATALQERSEEVLREWIARVRQHLAPGGETRAELEDHIPLFLKHLQAALRGQSSADHTSPEAGTSAVGREHGAQRFRLGFELGTLVREYGVLRDLLLDLIVAQGLHVSLEEIRLLTNFVATAITEAVEEHTRQQERARREEREAQNARLAEQLEALQRSETWLSTVLRSIGEAVIVTDVEGRAVFLNPVAEALTGWSGQEARGELLSRIFPLLHEDTHAEVESPLRRVLSDGQTRKLASPTLLVRKDGTHVPIADSMAALRDAAGAVSGVVLVFQDVSDKRRQERELRIFQSMAEASRDFIVLVDLEGHVIYLNPAGQQLMGLSSLEQARATPMVEFVSDDHQEIMAREVIPRLLQGLTWQGEFLNRHQSTGENIPLAAHAFPIRNERGQVALLGSIGRDLRESLRQKAERERLFQETEQLRLQAEGERARLSALIQQTPAAIAVLRGPGLVIETLNRETCRVWGRSREQLEGRPLLEALPELRGQQFEALLHGVMDSGLAHVGSEVPIPVRRPDGTQDVCYFNFIYAPWWSEPEATSGVLILAMEVTEAVLARQAMQAERERSERTRTAMLDALAEQNLVAVNYLRGPEHVFERANPRYVQLVDREVLGQPFLQALPELEAQGIGALLEETFRTGTPHILRERPIQVRPRDGTPRERLFDFVLQPVRDAEGRIEGILNLAIDSTDHVRARRAAEQLAEQERARREAEAQLRLRAEDERTRLDALFQQAPVAISVLRGPRFIVELANPRILHLWGRTLEQVRGQPVLDALSELRGYGLGELLTGVLDTGEPFVATEMELRFARGEGGALETGYFNFVYAPLHDAQGHREGVLLVATEVTETVLARQKMEELLRRSREAERARSAVLDALSAQTLIAVCYQRGPELVYETANPLFRHMAGREVVGLSLRAAFPELRDHEETFGSVQRVFETGEPHVLRELGVPVARWLGGPVREGLFDFTYQPVRAPEGGVDGVLTLVIEVTEQVRLRQEAQRLAEEERTRRDFEQHLIGIVSHDLRNPLSAILLSVQMLLRREGLDTRTLQSLVRLRSSTERAVRMVRDLLDFTQARLGGGMKIERAPMDAHVVTRGTVEELQVTHPERELRLEQLGDGRMQGDMDRLAQMMGNLVSNALKYSPGDSPVTVRSLGEAGELRLEVHNSGNPIPAEAMARLFQPLQRAVEGPDKAGRSVGLGLYIVDQIVRAHGGDIQVSSNEREGTTFSVRLPRSG